MRLNNYFENLQKLHLVVHCFIVNKNLLTLKKAIAEAHFLNINIIEMKLDNYF